MQIFVEKLNQDHERPDLPEFLSNAALEGHDQFEDGRTNGGGQSVDVIISLKCDRRTRLGDFKFNLRGVRARFNEIATPGISAGRRTFLGGHRFDLATRTFRLHRRRWFRGRNRAGAKHREQSCNPTRPVRLNPCAATVC